MADKSLSEFSAPTIANIRTGPATEIEQNFELKPVLISNTSWRSAALSPSRMSPEMPYYFASFHSRSWEERSSGSMQIRKRILHGHSVPPIF
jgi:hypothetical protein